LQIDSAVFAALTHGTTSNCETDLLLTYLKIMSMWNFHVKLMSRYKPKKINNLHPMCWPYMYV